MYSMNQKLIVFEYSRCSEPNTMIHSRIRLIECVSEYSESLAHSFTCNDTKDLHTSPHPARISTLNSIPSSRTAQLSDIPPTDLTESLSSTDSLTECTDSSFTHTPHPTNQTDTGSPTNSTSFIRPFRIVTINFQSCRNKTQELEHLINSVKPDVIIGTETWLNSTINSNEIIKSALGFNVYRKDRPNKSYGGVLIAVTNNLISSVVTDLDTDCEILWVQIDLIGTKSLHIGSFYRPPNSDCS